MHDKNDTVIYVGKAKDLQKRVSQYFLRPQVGKVMKMVENVDYFETIIVQNEKEALILEMNLIHKYMPRYNILLKDDSHYPYIAIKKKGDVTVSIKRNNKDNKYTYFGPFPKSSSAFEVVDLLNKLYPIRKCKNIPSSPCLYYHLGQCVAPCINKINEETYEQIRHDIISFLNGNNSDKQVELKKKLKEAIDKQEFENAKEFKTLLDALEHLNDSMSVETKNKIDRDIFAYSSKEGYLALAYLIYRNGLLLGKHTHIVASFGDEEEQVAELITQLYDQLPAPKEIIINSSKVIEEISGYIDANIYSVTKGNIYDLVLSAKENADH
ncbi:MAG: excinuclease ABC subunit C, partial [Bacilli bacterium]|nr:excinuclease ABC subunit C [Bacilli bacterium]